MRNLLAGVGDHTDNYSLERKLHCMGYRRVGGCDEVGRGPLAGPVVAACVVLPDDGDHALFLDSKILSHRKRLDLSSHLREMGAFIGIGVVSERQIDRINILQASLLAMKLAIEEIVDIQPDFLLVDGKFQVPLTIPQQPLIKGESKSASIAAASIVAKVARDQMMDDFDRQFPGYNFHRHKGYPTMEHRDAIRALGPCPIHRMSFRGVREYVR